MAADILDKYMRLSQGKYLTPQQANIGIDDTMLAMSAATGITCSTSTTPCIGVSSMHGCTGIIIYNPKQHKAASFHNAIIRKEHVAKLVKLVRDNDEDKLQVHIVGSMPDSPDQDLLQIRMLRNLVQELEATPNTQIKTFDVLEKPHPFAFAVNSKNGRLIRGSSDVTKETGYNPADESHTHYFEGYDTFDDFFDGTTPEHKATKRRR